MQQSAVAPFSRARECGGLCANAPLRDVPTSRQMMKWIVLAVALLLSAPLGAQQRADSVRGRVTTDSGAAVVAADVFVTMAPTAAVFSVKSDSSGRYVVA